MSFVFAPAGPLLFVVSVAMVLATCWLFYATRALLIWCRTAPDWSASTVRALVIGAPTLVSPHSFPATSESDTA
jgi:hypothetical protein